MTGTVLPFAGSAAPDGWLLCYGQAVSRTTYANLFAIIGTTFGAVGGSHVHALATPQIPAHTHGYGYTANTNRSSSSGGSEVTLIAGSAQLTQSTGGGQSHPNLQPTMILNSIIKD